MGPARKSAVPTAPLRQCLFCRGGALSAVAQKQAKVNISSCARSLCAIFGLPEDHPFRIICEKAQYCEECLREVEDADVALGKLELLKQTLLRFQNRVYSKVGDNYFQIENRDKLNAYYADFEKGGESMKGRKFSYDEIVKVFYEKLDTDCLNWERFSSEEKPNTCPVIKVDISTQTESNTALGKLSSKQTATPSALSTEVNIPEDNDWNCDDGMGDDAMVGLEFDASSSSVTVIDDLTTTQSVADPDIVGLPLPFTKAPTNFEQKIFCTFDRENCKRFFYDDYNLSVHIKSFHEGNPLPHVCSVCKKGFVDEPRLKNHYIRTHDTSSHCMCEHCGRGFPTAKILKEHVRKRHVEGCDATICKFCNAPFSTPALLEKHELLHRAQDVPFFCVICVKAFSNSYILKNHVDQEHSDNKVTCTTCNKRLASANSLRLHMKIHTDEFACNQCSFTGSSKNALRQHLQIHTDEKPFTCEQCGLNFKFVKNLTAHMRIHTGEKPYVCSICGMNFREQSYLRRHEESHSATANYLCTDCGAKFKVKENMNKHKRAHKPGFVPKKKKPKMQTEEQKIQRRLRRQQAMEKNVEEVKTIVVRVPVPTKTTSSPVSIKKKSKLKKSLKLKDEKRKRKKTTKSSGKAKPIKKPRKKREVKYQPKIEECDIVIEEQESNEEYVGEVTVDMDEEIMYEEIAQVTTAVTSMQPGDAVDSASVPEVYSVVYTNEFPDSPHSTTTATLIPVTAVVRPANAKTASEIVFRNRQRQKSQAAQQYHFL